VFKGRCGTPGGPIVLKRLEAIRISSIMKMEGIGIWV